MVKLFGMELNQQEANANDATNSSGGSKITVKRGKEMTIIVTSATVMTKKELLDAAGATRKNIVFPASPNGVQAWRSPLLEKHVLPAATFATTRRAYAPIIKKLELGSLPSPDHVDPTRLDASFVPTSDTEIMYQINYYFSEDNLVKDESERAIKIRDNGSDQLLLQRGQPCERWVRQAHPKNVGSGNRT